MIMRSPWAGLLRLTPFFLAVLLFCASCGEPKKVAGKYFAVRNSPVASIEFHGRRALLTTAGLLRLVFELDYEVKKDMLYLKDPANGPIPFKILNSTEIVCGDSAYGGKFRKNISSRSSRTSSFSLL